MRDYAKKPEDELLVVHKPPPSANRMGREPVEAPDLVDDVEGLADRLRAAPNARERKRLLGAIQGRFGNAMAERVMEAFLRAGRTHRSRRPATRRRRTSPDD